MRTTQRAERAEEVDLSEAPGGMAEIEPLDEHNRALVDNVHPPSWVNPEPAQRYNLVVIGAGTAGLVTPPAPPAWGRGWPWWSGG